MKKISQENKFNLFKTEAPEQNTIKSQAYSKEKYTQSFASNIFFNKENNEHKEIKVNRVKNTEPKFTPKFKDKNINSLQRKICQLKGSSSGLLSSFHEDKTATKKGKEKEDVKDYPSSSHGYYKNEQLVKTKLSNDVTAKERYYAYLSNSNTFDTKLNSNDITRGRCNSVANIHFTNEKISKMDNSKVEFKNDSRQFLYDNLYSNKIFHNKSMRDLSVKTDKKQKKQDKKNLFSSMNWDDLSHKQEYDPKKVKLHTYFDYQSDWKEINTEIIKVKKYDPKKKFYAKEFKQRVLTSSINGSSEPIDNYDKEVKTNKEDGFRKFKNKSQENLIQSERRNKNVSISTITNHKQRKAYDISSSQVFNTDKIKNSNGTNNSNIKNNNCSGIEIKNGNTNTYLVTESSKNQNDFKSPKYEIDLPSNEVQSTDVKKMLISNGLHIYNVKEVSKWTNGNDSTKLVFQVRNIPENNEDKVISNIKEKGFEAHLAKEIPNIPERKSDMFPVQAKWNDTNIRNYHTSAENCKKPQKTDYAVKKSLPFDKNLLMYKNDKMNAPVLKKTEKNSTIINKSKASNNNINSTNTNNNNNSKVQTDNKN